MQNLVCQNPEGKRQLDRPRCKRDCNIKLDRINMRMRTVFARIRIEIKSVLTKTVTKFRFP
jgi:hypothetical protein